MNLSRILDPECVQIVTTGKDKESVLRTIASIATKSEALSGVAEETILGALKEREKLGSTGFGDGIAIPHCALDKISEFVVGILTAPDGVEFDSADGKPVKILVFIVGPTSGRSRHISVLATISRVFSIPGATEELVLAGNAVSVRDRFLQYSREEVDTKGQIESCMFHVVVQDEEKLSEILQVFVAVEARAVAVTEAKEAGEFLHRLPLFASFWSDEHDCFNRVITAVVNKAMANDAIRQINDVAGGLDKTSGVMVVVQDVFYAAGSLNS